MTDLKELLGKVRDCEDLSRKIFSGWKPTEGYNGDYYSQEDCEGMIELGHKAACDKLIPALEVAYAGLSLAAASSYHAADALIELRSILKQAVPASSRSDIEGAK